VICDALEGTALAVDWAQRVQGELDQATRVVSEKEAELARLRQQPIPDFSPGSPGTGTDWELELDIQESKVPILPA